MDRRHVSRDYTAAAMCCRRRFRRDGAVALARWRRVALRVLMELRRHFEAQYAGQVLAYWRDRRTHLLRLP